jgi:hypothetical protein
MDVEDPIRTYKEISRNAPDNAADFGNWTGYLHRLSAKHPAQLKRHAIDWVEYWRQEPGEGKYDRFVARINNLRSFAPGLVALTVAYGDVSNLLPSTGQQGIYGGPDLTFEFSPEKSHFDLLDRGYLQSLVTRVALSPSD